ncbi:ABCA1 [Mytilus edulis]|uniref:ABCA1 n=1 Tax=Mytilus edulis TaxID=6550 RepID=A0A8S3V8J2_MYTED|nr:ABCA1 [Mytilus edulis]
MDQVSAECLTYSEIEQQQLPMGRLYDREGCHFKGKKRKSGDIKNTNTTVQDFRSLLCERGQLNQKIIIPTLSLQGIVQTEMCDLSTGHFDELYGLLWSGVDTARSSEEIVDYMKLNAKTEFGSDPSELFYLFFEVTTSFQDYQIDRNVITNKEHLPNQPHEVTMRKTISNSAMIKINCGAGQEGAGECSNCKSGYYKPSAGIYPVYCGPGEEGTDTCTPCKDDYYKSTGGRTACLQCTGHMTSTKNDRTKCTYTVIVAISTTLLKILVCLAQRGEYKSGRGLAKQCQACTARHEIIGNPGTQCKSNKTFEDLFIFVDLARSWETEYNVLLNYFETDPAIPNLRNFTCSEVCDKLWHEYRPRACVEKPTLCDKNPSYNPCESMFNFLYSGTDISVSNYTWKDVLEDVNSVLEMISKYEKLFEDASLKLIFAEKNRIVLKKSVLAIIFDEDHGYGLESHVKYFIRMNKDRVDKTNRVQDKYWRPTPRSKPGIDTKYVTYGFAFLQDMIDHAIIKIQTYNTSDVGVITQMFPYPCYIQDKFGSAFSLTLPLFLVLAWMLTVALICKNIVYEKEMRLKEGMKIMGLGNGVHWLAWFIDAFIVMFISLILMVIMLKAGKVVEHSDPTVILFILTAFTVATISQCFLFSVFFSKANIAACVSGILYFMLYLIYPLCTLWEELLTSTHKSIAGLSSSVALGFASSYVARYEEQAIGIQWSNIADTPLVHGNANIEEEPKNKKSGCVDQKPKESLQEWKQSSSGWSILTGLIPPSDGTAFIYGHSILTEMDAVRDSLGMCSQHNLLFDKLTVEEHLWFYARLKNLEPEKVKQEMARMIEDVGLPHKRMSYLRPSLVIIETTIIELYTNTGCNLIIMRSRWYEAEAFCSYAFVGNAKTVILDEPTAGIDPYARKEIWELLLKLKKSMIVFIGRTIILSTHHMDEADVLGDRIAIISQGKLCCCGSSLYLKSQYGNGYYLTLVQDDGKGNGKGFSSRRTTELILQYVKNAQLVEENNTELTYQLPSEAAHSGQFEQLFEQLERCNKDMGISSFGISDTSLEEVFLRVADETGVDENDESKRTKLERGNYSMFYGYSCRKDSYESLWIEDGRLPGYDHLDFPQCDCSSGFQVCPSGAGGPEPPKKLLPTTDYLYNMTGRNISDWLVKTMKPFQNKRYGGFSFGDVNNISSTLDPNRIREAFENIPQSEFCFDNTLSIQVWYNNDGWTAIVSYMNVMNNLILRSLLNLVRSQNSMSDSIIDLIMAICLIFSMSYIAASFILVLIEERSSDFKHLQFVSGVNPCIYWLSNFFMDMIKYWIASILCIVIFLAFQTKAYVGPGNLEVLFPTADIVWNIRAVNTKLKKLFLLFPQYCLGRGLIDLSRNQLQADISEIISPGSYEEAWKSPFEFDLVGRNLLSLFCIGTLSFVLNLLIEYNFFLKRSWSCFWNSKPNFRSLADEDIDVANERQRINSEQTKDDVLIVDNLTKVYRNHGKKGRNIAVDRSCFGVPNGQCFGLLGVNGAGKTSIFQMLTGDVGVTQGYATLNGHSIIKDLEKVRLDLGYCPQLDTFDPLLTARESLNFFARLRGIQEKDIKQIAEWGIHKLRLIQYGDRIAYDLSGGNRRKLSTAISLIGNPSAIFMDEPTTGMDPHARRFLWNCINNIVKDGRSVVLTSHRYDYEQLSDGL